MESDYPYEDVTKVHDFLHRWKFREALFEAVGSVNQILPPHQELYFETPQTFWKEKEGFGENGEKQPFLSSIMIEISHMTRGDIGNKRVSRDKIIAFLRDVSIESRLTSALSKSVGRDGNLYFAKEFARTLLWETLINTEEHPNATMSMIALARNKLKNEIVVAISDNGKTIPLTIYEYFKSSSVADELSSSISINPIDRKIACDAFGEKDANAALLKYKNSAAATIYASRKGTSSKPNEPQLQYEYEVLKESTDIENANIFLRGQGLYYVKERTLEFNGTLSIRAGCSEVCFYKEGDKEKVKCRLLSPWPGNLVRIALPVTIQ